MAKAKITQQMIADQLGVSQTVVSGVLNGRPVRVSEEKRRLVLEKLGESGYKRTRRVNDKANLIMLIVHSEDWNNLQPLSHGAGRALTESGDLLVQHEWTTKDIPPALFENVKGYISASEKFVCELSESSNSFEKPPVVLLMEVEAEVSVDRVSFDPVPGTRKAVNALWKMGHRRFGYFGFQEMPSFQARRAGAFWQSLMEMGIALPESEWTYFPLMEDRNEAETRRHLSDYIDCLNCLVDKPTAIIFETAYYAEWFRNMAVERGMRVPEDISVVGHADSVEHNPGIAKIVIPWDEMGYMAAKLLKTRIENPELPFIHHRVAQTWKPDISIGAVI